MIVKNSLRKLRGLALPKHGRTNILPPPPSDELAQATQDMRDMRDCYDNLLSAAAAATNSAYEFSESLREIGSCLLEKTALNDDEESGKVLLMLGKMQFELEKHIDNYRSHISQTITIPSESLLNELRIVEEMKRQCDEKRDVYEDMLTRCRERGRSRGGKTQSFSLQQLETARNEYDHEATLFVFRLKSLKQGQSWSLLTQAARHHGAQLCFFKKAVKSLETVEPHVKSVAEQRHIDYHFTGLEEEDEDDDESDDGDDDDDDVSYNEHDDGELSFDYRQNEREQDVSASQNSTKVNIDRLRQNSFSFRFRTVSQSAPLFADTKTDYGEQLRRMRPSLSRKFSSYVLPTPVDAKRVDAKSSISSKSINLVTSKMKPNSKPTKILWHSSPLQQNEYENILSDEKFSGPAVRNAQSVLKESNSDTASTRLPPPLADGAVYPKKIKTYAFSGPLASNPWPTKPTSLENIQLISGPLLWTPMPQPPSSSSSSSSSKVSLSANSTITSSPKISELHELPRPPISSPSNSRQNGLVGHSGPLVSGGQRLSAANNLTASNMSSPLPLPPLAIARSFSIPSGGARVAALHRSGPPEAPRRSTISEDFASPPLTPVFLSSSRPSSDGSETLAGAV